MRIILTKSQIQTKLTDQTESVVFIDVQTSADSIPGSVALDIKTDLSGDNTFLPNPEKLAVKLGELGISNDDTLVIYDEGSNRGASKAWFVFHYLGHEAVYILQGGRNAWDETIKASPKRTARSYLPNLRKSAVADIETIKADMNNQNSVLIDSRANQRYRGEVEPAHTKAGHIPGAKNYQVKDVFTEGKTFKSQVELANHFGDLEDKSKIIVSCGSGNSACMNLVAMKEAGLENVILYPGGFGEWIADNNNEIETE